MTVVGGLDLFPPDPAIGDRPTTSTRSPTSASSTSCSSSPRSASGGRSSSCRTGTVGLYQDARRDRARRPRDRRHAAARPRRTAPCCATRRRCTLGPRPRRRRSRSDAGGTTYSCSAVVVCADAWTNDVLAGLGASVPLTTTLEQVTYFAPGRPGALRPGAAAAVDLDGRAVVLRLPLLRRGDGQGRPGLRRAGRSTRTPGPSSPTPRWAPAWPPTWRRCCPGPGRRCARSAASTPSPPTATSCSPPVPGHPSVVVGLGAAHGFKFAPTFGRMLADLATAGTDLLRHRRPSASTVPGSPTPRSRRLAGLRPAVWPKSARFGARGMQFASDRRGLGRPSRCATLEGVASPDRGRTSAQPTSRAGGAPVPSTTTSARSRVR